MSMFDNIIFDEFTLLEYGVADREVKRSTQRMISDIAEKDKKKNMNRGKHPELADSDKQREEKYKAISTLYNEKVNRASKISDYCDGMATSGKSHKEIKQDKKNLKNNLKHADIAYNNASRERNFSNISATTKSIMRHNRKTAKQEAAFALIEAYEPEFIY